MKVQELIDKLSKLDPNLFVQFLTEDEKLLGTKDVAFVLFDLVEIGVQNCEGTQLPDNTPYLKIGDTSNQMALVSLTTDF
jgi:hypothetical protein